MPQSNLKSCMEKLTCLLGLKREVVGVEFVRTASEYEKIPVKSLKGSLSYCAMVRLACLGHGRKAAADHIRCPGARRALGLTPTDDEFYSGRRYYSLGLYRDLACARETALAVNLMDHLIHGVLVQPLSMCQTLPHVVVVICTANQAMRLIQGHIYHCGPQNPLLSLGTQGVCAELTVRPHVTAKPNASLLCSNTRYTCRWEEGEVGLGFPLAGFLKAVDGVEATLNAAEPDSKKKEILDRGGEKILTGKIRQGAAYYMPGALPVKQEPR